MDNKKSSIGGIEANIVVLICYLGGLLLAWFYDTKILAWLLPLIIYIIERENEFVKKHAAQASVLYFGYSMISLIIMFISISTFNISNIFTMNLTNFEGSLLMASTLSMIAMLILVVITILSVIVSSKVWHYEDYDIPFVKYFVKSFRKFMDNLMKSKGKDNKHDDDNIIVSSDVKENEKEVILEDDSLVVVKGEINDKKEIKQKDKKESDKEGKDK